MWVRWDQHPDITYFETSIKLCKNIHSNQVVVSKKQTNKQKVFFSRAKWGGISGEDSLPLMNYAPSPNSLLESRSSQNLKTSLALSFLFVTRAEISLCGACTPERMFLISIKISILSRLLKVVMIHKLHGQH